VVRLRRMWRFDRLLKPSVSLAGHMIYRAIPYVIVRI
jgi:hypothetical protein